MTTLNEARKAIYDEFATEWGTTTPYQKDNQDDGLDSGDVPWARITVRHTGGGQETLGPVNGRRFRRTGTVFVQIFTKVNRGTKDGDDLAHTARAIFEGTGFDGLDFTNALVRETGPDGKWFQHTVTALFEYEETK